MEFRDVRQYQPGDDYRSIDWRVTSRTGQLHVKEFHEERQRTLLMAVDVSGSLRFGTARRLKSEVLAEDVRCLAFSAEAARTEVGLLLSRIGSRPSSPRGRAWEHVLRIVREILVLRAEGSRAPTFRAAFSAINHLLPRRATVFLCSDFHGSHRDEAWPSSRGTMR